MLTVDLHLHTTFSDGKMPLSKLIDLCGSNNLDAIAITDHMCATKHILGLSAKLLGITLTENNWKEYQLAVEKEKNRAWREYKMIVYVGAEFTHNTFSHGRNAHMLAIDLKEFISPKLSEEGWLKEARSQGALTVAAHPLKLKDAASQTYYLFDNAEKFAPLLDLWEVANAQTIWRQMLKTPYSLIASSDLHSANKWASWRTKINCVKDPDAIKNFLKNKNNHRKFSFVYGQAHEVSHQVEAERETYYDDHDAKPVVNTGWAACYG
jgi:processive 1,2-diacylglycerol beta-glucosyltransferase